LIHPSFGLAKTTDAAPAKTNQTKRYAIGKDDASDSVRKETERGTERVREKEEWGSEGRI